jgi:hypothetical protein
MRKHHRRPFPLHAVAVALLLIMAGTAVYVSAGCGAIDLGGTQARMAEAKEQLAATQAKAAADAAAAREAIAAALAANNAAGAAAAQSALAKANETSALAEQWSKKLAEAQALLTKAVKPDGSLDAGGAIGAAAPLLPPPWNLLLGIAAPLAVGLLQEIRVRRENAAAVSIINGIEAVKSSNPAMRPILDAAKPILTEEFTSRAIDLVDQHKLASRT